MLKLIFIFAASLLASVVYYLANGFCLSEEAVSTLTCLDGSNCPPICSGTGWLVHVAAALSAAGLVVTLGLFTSRKSFRPWR